jgi:hypothetical protein
MIPQGRVSNPPLNVAGDNFFSLARAWSPVKKFPLQTQCLAYNNKVSFLGVNILDHGWQPL